jgi:hypothetical protein
MSTSNLDLNGALQGIISSTSDWFENKLTFSPDFTVSYVDPLDTCQGKYLELTTPIVSTDRLVASNVADLSPGTLIDKLTAGTSITLDDATIPGQVIINSTAADTYKVKASSTDTTPNYLVDKVVGVYNGAQGLGIIDAYNPVSKTVDFTPYIDWTVFIPQLLNEIAADPALSAQLCALVCTCSCASTTTTTTTAPPTTTTTTTLAPIWDPYIVAVYSCADCGAGPDATLVTGYFPTGTLVTVGNFYQPVTLDGNVYEIISAGVAGSTVQLNELAGATSCTLACSILPPP